MAKSKLLFTIENATAAESSKSNISRLYISKDNGENTTKKDQSCYFTFWYLKKCNNDTSLDKKDASVQNKPKKTTREKYHYHQEKV